MLKKQHPETLHLEITWDCNLKCELCPRRAGHGQQWEIRGRELSVEEIRQIVVEVPCKQVNLIGAGEPMVHSRFYEVLKTIRKPVMFTTNGMLLTERNVRRLPENVRNIHISIDSPDEVQYKKMRKGADLNQIIDNMDGLQQLRPNIEIVIQTLLLRENWCILERLVDIAKEAGASIKFIHPICFTREMQQKHLRLKCSLNEVYQYAKQQGIRIVHRPTEPEQHFCFSPFKSVLVAIDGSVYPCCYIYEGRGEETVHFSEWFQDEKIDVPMRKYRMGNLFDQKFKDIWFNERWMKLRQHLIKQQVHDRLQTIRKNKKAQKGFEYCDMCLFRWKMAC